jgi:crotonobetainyl-CoA dehydrogenase
MMDFRFSDEQELLVENIRKLMISENWDSDFKECDEKHEYPERFVKELCEIGFDRIMLPEEHGGFDAGLVTLTAAYEELGRWGAPTYVLYELFNFSTVLREGTEEQKEIIMSFLGTGKQMLNSAITEPGAGSDVGGLQTTYTRKNGKVYLNGHKTFITSSAGAPYLVVMARDSEKEERVFTEWFVDMTKPGIKLEKLDKLGQRMDSCCEVYFDNVELEEKDMFGTEGNGFNRVTEEFDFERFIVGCVDYGMALCAFEDAAKYANQREQFGKKIGRFQLTQDKFAHMGIKIRNMRNLLFESAWKYDNGEINSGDAAMCKYYCANAGFEVADAAMQVLGGVGIAGDHRISRIWRDLRVDRVSGGTDEMQILTAAKSVLKQYR